MLFFLFSSSLSQISVRREKEKEEEEEEEKERRILLANNCDTGWDLENSICWGTFSERGAGE